MSDFIVIGQTKRAFMPKILLRTENQELARSFAHKHLRESQLDVLVLDLDTGLCELALTVEPPDPNHEH